MDARVTPLCLDVKDEMNGIAALDVHPHWRYVLDTGGRRPGADAGLCVSIHALRKEGDGAAVAEVAKYAVFLSTPSARRATIRVWALSGSFRIFLSTPSARRATLPFCVPYSPQA